LSPAPPPTGWAAGAGRQLAPQEHAPEPDSGVRFHFDSAFGTGRLQHLTDGFTERSDSTKADYYRLGFELLTKNQLGGGLRIEGVASDDDLFVASGNLAHKATDASVLAHFTSQFDIGRARIPIRVGLCLRSYEVEDGPTVPEIEWRGIGPYLELEPDIPLVHGETARVSLRGRLGVGFGEAEIGTEPASRDYDGKSTSLDFAIGAHVEIGHFDLGVAYLVRRLGVESDGGPLFSDIDVQFEGITGSLALRF
jgi:hypothetical protein